MTPGPHAEAVLFSRYLLGQDPPPELADRYAAACAHLFPTHPSPADAAILAYALAHPRALPALDSAAALLRPGSLLRRKVLVMAAVLEATPAGAEHFLPRARTLSGLTSLLFRTAVSAAWNLALGIPLLWLAQRRDRTRLTEPAA